MMVATKQFPSFPVAETFVLSARRSFSENRLPQMSLGSEMPHRRSVRIVGATLLVYALLVASHLGEFWPFSIYPMFSQAGNPWTRAVVRTVPDEPEAHSWDAVPFTDLPGNPYPVVPQGISQNDVANYVSKTENWTEQRLNGFRSLFGKRYDFSKPLLVMKVRGALVGDSVSIKATPVMRLEQDTTFFNPSLSSSPAADEPEALSVSAQ